MHLNIYAKGTKIKLSQPWEVEFHEDGDQLWPKPKKGNVVLEKGTVLSIHDIDIRGNAAVPKSMKFYIVKGGCPKNPEWESSAFHVTLLEAANIEFEFATKADAKLNDLDAAYLQIEKEIK